jgi:curved DNA-binding protein CbpA
MNLNEDYYRLLQVHPAATQQEIRKAYRKLAHQYHPDKAVTTAAPEAFALLQKAYATLSNTNSRKNYDLVYFSKRINQAAAADITDPRKLIQLMINLRNRIQTQDASMINSGAVHAELTLILAEEHLLLLGETNVHFKYQFLDEVQACLRALAYPQSADILQHLKQHCSEDVTPLLTKMRRELRLMHMWNYLKLPLAFIITITLCLYMYYNA